MRSKPAPTTPRRGSPGKPPADTGRLSRQVQVRFTDRQYGWLVQVAEATGRPLGALVRDLVVVAVINWLNEDGDVVDVEAAVLELQELGDRA